MAQNKKDPMEVENAIDALNEALRLQLRSPLAYTLVAGTMVGFTFQGLAGEMRAFALAELEDARHLVEKIATLAGRPVTKVAPLKCPEDPADAVAWLIETETEAVDALQNVIPYTGQEGRSEAMEHRLEHIIMRKQEQIDTLIRASRSS